MFQGTTCKQTTASFLLSLFDLSPTFLFSSSRIIEVQTQLAERTLELLLLDPSRQATSPSETNGSPPLRNYHHVSSFRGDRTDPYKPLPSSPRSRSFPPLCTADRNIHGAAWDQPFRIAGRSQDPDRSADEPLCRHALAILLTHGLIGDHVLRCDWVAMIRKWKLVFFVSSPLLFAKKEALRMQ